MLIIIIVDHQTTVNHPFMYLNMTVSGSSKGQGKSLTGQHHEGNFSDLNFGLSFSCSAHLAFN